MDSLVNVLVAVEHDVHAVLHEDRLEDFSELDLGTSPCRGIERVMKVGDLPVGSRCRQLLVQPLDLLRIHVIAVEHEEADVALLEGPVAVPSEIERLIELLVGIVVISQRRVEFDFRIQQRFVGALELRQEINRLLEAKGNRLSGKSANEQDPK